MLISAMTTRPFDFLVGKKDDKVIISDDVFLNLQPNPKLLIDAVIES